MVHQLRDMGVHRRALELCTSTNSIVQSEAVNLIYWLAQDPESKQAFVVCLFSASTSLSLLTRPCKLTGWSGSS